MTRVSTRMLVLLFIAFLALAAGAFNLRDRLNQKPTYSDGVLWRDVTEIGDDGRPFNKVVADKVEPGSPAALAGVYRGDALLGISTTGGFPFDEITRGEHVQILSDQGKGQPGIPKSVKLRLPGE